MSGALERQQSRLDALERELVVAGPASVLARGYSVTTLPDGAAVRSVSGVSPGVTISTRVADGSFTSVTTDGEAPAPPIIPIAPSTPSPALPPRSRPPKKKRTKKPDPNQLGLF